ncbi:MAG: type II toxin-antitoxin system HicA family toxin [Acidobacteriaceae bacterium]|nr:type II toxin-antitoxin system HicA family toxin [Acidobacteriaceae bacterium]MBV9296319.1 type II toxin-antitoxin system HicA family toxin [Acidobacteriaceae bacterium]MBV9765432.1 type II toxin-antitoxin system HicA family toxin [Acidobacteriaceae bacterium]
MSRTPRVNRRRAHCCARKSWFRVIPVRGSHHFLRHEDGRTTVVPIHSGETIGPGLLHKIVRDCQLSAEQFAELT